MAATAPITIAAGTARGSSSSTDANGRNASVNAPTIAPAQRVRAPAARFSAVRENEPPTGRPPATPAARLAVPWATSSRSASQAPAPLPARSRAIAVGSMNPTTAITSAGRSSVAASPQGRSSGDGGQPACMSPITGPA